MFDIAVPRLNSNDATATVVEWRAADAENVQQGDVVAVIETAKATAELEAPASGVVRHDVPEGAEAEPGSVIGRICPDRAAWEAAERLAEHEAAPQDLVLTRAARELARRHRLGEEELRGLGRRLVREADVAALVPGNSATDGPRVRLSARQREIAATVSRVHQQVPQASLVMKADATALSAVLDRARRDRRTRLGLTELVIKSVASLRGRFPRCFARFDGGDSYELLPGAHVAVTVDTGSGLFLPVARDADTVSVADLGQWLLTCAVRAARDRFELADFAGANVALSLHTEPGVVQALPLIPPGLVGAVTLCGPSDEVALDDSGRAYRRPVVHLGLAYDHRVVNGREAMTFLTALRDTLESAHQLGALIDGAKEGTSGHDAD
ncbi:MULTISPECIES: 2-oxo acid dehydrogenase subunit E2 [unclassified Streptomyces]|uniref:2-oxo acid dehydrogenase subunit E2 n=1 Tax=unclassified Streptomyces TaxID=2593676 RepID=UPI002E31D09D|nr:2-oxo acid dehydrogenase subunit E2 [Streptomyces sp. NBC_01431]